MMSKCNDTINRQAAIDGKILIQRTNGVEIYYDEAVPVEYLKRLPSVQSEQRWISTENKLPDNNTDVLLQFKSNMGVGFYEDDVWAVNTGEGISSTVGYDEEKPIAWMSLPEPYQEDKQDDLISRHDGIPAEQKLIHIIFETLAECGIYGEEATIKLIGTLKRLQRYDLIPPCERGA